MIKRGDRDGVRVRGRGRRGEYNYIFSFKILEQKFKNIQTHDTVGMKSENAREFRTGNVRHEETNKIIH